MVHEISKMMLEMKFKQNHEKKSKPLECIVDKKLSLYKNDWEAICEKEGKRLRVKGKTG